MNNGGEQCKDQRILYHTWGLLQAGTPMPTVRRGALLLDTVLVLRIELDLNQLGGLVRRGLPFPLTNGNLGGLSQHGVSALDV